jgi:penicillin G amidase
MKLRATDDIIIERLNGGIPCINVKNAKDKYFGLGFCHGYDRGMQLMLMKILGQGKGSEYLESSDEMLEIDQFFRRMNWHNNIGEELKKLNDEERELLDSYCNGINKAFEKRKPWELRRLLGFRDFKWNPEDCFLITRMSGYISLAQSQGEIERLFIELVQKNVNRELLNELFPNILDDFDESLIKQVKLTEKIIPDSVKWNPVAAAFMASNNWVISGARTKSGKPILANDPHLEVNRLPAIWYEAAIRLNDHYSHGATMPGLPSILIGRNKDLSWGVTYAFMDATDSWIEKCKGGKYFKDGDWHDFKKRKEIIKRKKKDDFTITFYENEHGVLDGIPLTEDYFISRKWSGDCSGAESIKAAFKLDSATNVKDAMDIAGGIESAFSWVFADSSNIGLQMSGLLPKRKNGAKGFTPQLGWNSENDWEGYHSYKDLPRLYNPEEGFIVTANNNLNHLGDIEAINIPMGSYRADRIKQLIEAKEKHTVEVSQKMQYDLYSLQAEKFMKIIGPLLPETENGEILRNWDYSYDTKSKAAFLFEMIYRGLYHNVFGDVIGKSITEFLQNETGIFIDFYDNFDSILLSEKSAWFNGKTRDSIYKKVIEESLDLSAKEWGKYNKITLSHILFGGKLPKFFGFDKGPFQLAGGRATIHQGQVYKSGGRTTSFAASFRIVTDMDKPSLYTNYIGGVSDRRFSRYYNNGFKNWLNGIFKKF